MAAAMDGLDALVFTGGIGEHQPRGPGGRGPRPAFLGVRLDEQRNQAATGGRRHRARRRAGARRW